MDLSLILATLSMFCFGINGGLAKPLINKVGAVRYGVYRNGFLSVTMLIMLLLNLKTVVWDFNYIIFALIISVVIYAGFIIGNIATFRGRVGVVSPLTSSRILITTLLASFLLGEKLSAPQLGLIFFILAGIVVISLNIKQLEKAIHDAKHSGVVHALICVGIFGVIMTFYGPVTAKIGANLMGFIVEGIIFVASVTQLIVTKQPVFLTKEETKPILHKIIWVGILSTVGVILNNYAYQMGNVSLVTAILASAPIVTTLYARHVHKEHSTFQENVGVLMVTVGVITLSVIK